MPAVADQNRVPVDRALCVTRTRDGGQSFEVLREGLPQTDCFDLVYRHGLAVADDGKTLLDNTVVVWCSEIAKGNTHSHKDAPFLLCGSAGGAWQTNRYLSFTNDVPHNNLLVSLMNGMGVPTTTFGDPTHCTGPLAGLI